MIKWLTWDNISWVGGVAYCLTVILFCLIVLIMVVNDWLDKNEETKADKKLLSDATKFRKDFE